MKVINGVFQDSVLAFAAETAGKYKATSGCLLNSIFYFLVFDYVKFPQEGDISCSEHWYITQMHRINSTHCPTPPTLFKIILLFTVILA